MHFLTGFLIMNAWLIPPKHAFPIGRLLLWFGFGNIGFREGWEDAITWNTYQRKHNPVEGRHRYLVVAILSTEAIVAYKYRYGTGNLEFNPTPLYVSIPWAIVFSTCFLYWIYLRFIMEGRTVKYIEKDTTKGKPKAKQSDEDEGETKSSNQKANQKKAPANMKKKKNK